MGLPSGRLHWVLAGSPAIALGCGSQTPGLPGGGQSGDAAPAEQSTGPRVGPPHWVVPRSEFTKWTEVEVKAQAKMPGGIEEPRQCIDLTAHRQAA